MSYVLWCLSSNLIIFILARFLGGISKGNVSLSMAIIADVSSMQTRGKGMALVGIAFSLGFIVGPLIGAIFAVWAKNRTDQWFVVPALFALILSVADLLFFITFFKETLPSVCTYCTCVIFYLIWKCFLGKTCQNIYKKPGKCESFNKH